MIAGDVDESGTGQEKARQAKAKAGWNSQILPLVFTYKETADFKMMTGKNRASDWNDKWILFLSSKAGNDVVNDCDEARTSGLINQEALER